MAKFFVGQRVRIVRAQTQAGISLIGRSAVVIEVAEFADGEVGYGLDIAPIFFDEGWVIWGAHQLEPITPPHVAGSWEVIEQLLPNIREGVAA